MDGKFLISTGNEFQASIEVLGKNEPLCWFVLHGILLSEFSSDIMCFVLDVI